MLRAIDAFGGLAVGMAGALGELVGACLTERYRENLAGPSFPAVAVWVSMDIVQLGILL